MQQLADGTQISRAPRDLDSWEIIATYRHAWALAQFRPTAHLAKALANWQAAAQAELQRRGQWRPEALPPQSM